ncbi:MAG: hypothetical protein LC808_24255, partial [Actinobacteria bacterium]|nr:hypothetical protein [Actinomycetota bacterium]
LVAIRSAVRPPAWDLGARVSLGDVNQHGTPVTAAPQAVGGRMRAIVTAQGSRSFMTAFTCGQHEAVVGNTVEVYVAAPVRGLKAERFGQAARLSWIWPDGATSAAVEWRPTDGSTDPGGSSNCLRQVYDREGGFEVVVGAKPVTLSVHAVVNQPEGLVRSPPAEVRLAQRSISVRYRLVRSGWRHRSVSVELWAEEPCDLAPIVVVHRPGKVMPRRPSDGTVLSRIEGVTLDGVHRTRAPQMPMRLPSDVTEGWLVCFVESPSTTIRLIAPPAQELKVG